MEVSPISAAPAPTPHPPSPATTEPIRFFFGSDPHDAYNLVDKFISQANAQKPDLVLIGGDIVELGTEKEHRLFKNSMAGLQVPYQVVPGNHDIRRDEWPRFVSDFGRTPRSFDFNGIHFILLDDARQQLTEESFQFLEADLAANRGKTTVVAMHVPPFWPVTSPWADMLLDRLKNRVAGPRLEDPAQARRFTDLMVHYGVALVLSGHTHVPRSTTVDGVQYVTAGAVGGKLVRRGTNHEYLDIGIVQGKIAVQHVALDNPVDRLGDLIKHDADYLYRTWKRIRAALASLSGTGLLVR